MNKTLLYFLRHGEVYNPKRILYGRLPRFPLSEKGKQHIEKTAEELQDKNIEYIYASPLLRTRQTANIVRKKLRIQPKFSSLLLEVDLLCQGIPLEQFEKDVQPHIYDEAYLEKGQESPDAIAQRMFTFVQQTTRKHAGHQVLAVSHGDPIVILEAYIRHIPFTWEYKKENYIQTGTFRTLEYMNGVYHWKS